MKCTKVYFVDEKNALMYINKLKKTSHREKKPVRAYLCEKCLNWHLTSIESNSKELAQIVQLKMQVEKLKQKILNMKQQHEILQKRFMVEQKINQFL